MKKGIKFIIGIDEVGRGPLAGPVTVGAVSIKSNFRLPKMKLADSKKLSAMEREEWFEYIKNHPSVCFSTASVSAAVIDDIGINKATLRALRKALYGVSIKSQSIWGPCFQMNEVEIFLDGLLYAPAKYKNQKTIIRGDEKIIPITFASIVAKVSRDRQMIRMSKKYPEYGFDTHKGYGTKMHCKNIEEYGISKEHRVTYLRNFL